MVTSINKLKENLQHFINNQLSIINSEYDKECNIVFHINLLILMMKSKEMDKYNKLIAFLFDKKTSPFDNIDKDQLLIKLIRHVLKDKMNKTDLFSYEDDKILKNPFDLISIIKHNITHFIESNNSNNLIEFKEEALPIFSQLSNKNYIEAKEILVNYYQYHIASIANRVKCTVIILKKEFCNKNYLHLLKCYRRQLKEGYSYNDVLDSFKDVIQLKTSNILKCYLMTKKRKMQLGDILFAYKSFEKYSINSARQIKLQEITQETIKDGYLIIEIADHNSFLISSYLESECIKCRKPFNQAKTAIQFYCKQCSYYCYCSYFCLSEDKLHMGYHKTIDQLCSKSHSNKQLQTSSIVNISIGMKNLGNTCYMNSILQSLFHSKKMIKYFFNNPDYNKKNRLSQFKLSNSFLTLYNAYVKAENLKSYLQRLREEFVELYPQFSPYQPQDAHEFLSSFLNEIHKELDMAPQDSLYYLNANVNVTNMQSVSNIDNSFEPFSIPNLIAKDHNALSQSIQQFNIKKLKEDSIIMDIFYGQFYTTIQCLCCKNLIEVNELFLTLQLAIPLQKLSIQLFFFQSKINQNNIYFLTIFEKTILKQLKAVIAEQSSLKNSFPFLTIENIEAFIYSSNNASLELLDDDYIYVWDIYSKKETIIFYEKLNKELRIYCIENFPSSIPFPILINEGSMSIIEMQEKVFNYLDIGTERNNMQIEFYQKSKSTEKIHDKFIPFLSNNSNINNCLIDYYLKESQPVLLFFKISNYKRKSYNQINCNQENSSLDLIDCFELLSLKMLLDQWYCSNCKKKVKAEKMMRLSVPPQNLIIQLKRSLHTITSKGKVKGVKISALVKYPLTQLNISAILVDKASVHYELYAVVYHSSKYYVIGHYTAACKVNNQWYYFDDNKSPKTISENDVITNEAYILFYNQA